MADYLTKAPKCPIRLSSYQIQKHLIAFVHQGEHRKISLSVFKMIGDGRESRRSDRVMTRPDFNEQQCTSGMRKVLITGRGIVLGSHYQLETLWSHGMSALGGPPEGPVISNEALDDLAETKASDRLILSRHQRLALAATHAAFNEAQIPLIPNQIRGGRPTHHDPQFGCVSGSSLGGLCAFEAELESSARGRSSAFALTRWRGNAVGSTIAVRFGLGGMNLSINAASATGGQALALGGALIQSGRLDAVVVVAADQMPGSQIRHAMKRNGSLTRNPQAGPLSHDRSGMTPIEGAACLILESEDHLMTRDGVALASWIGGDTRNEAHHLLAPAPEARTLVGLIASMKELTPERKGPDWVSLHATGTRKYDALEAKALNTVFGNNLPWISAIKQFTGHSLSASGLIEAALLTEGLRREETLPWPKITDTSLDYPLNPPKPQPCPLSALQISQGMGGVVAVNLLGAIP